MNKSRAIRIVLMAVTTLAVASVLSNAYATHNPGHPPTNDNSSDAVAISAAPYVNNQSTVGATMEAGEVQPSSITSPGKPRCPNSTIGATVWYKHTPLTRQSLTASTFGSNFDTLLAVWVDWQGDGVLSLVGCQDNFGSRHSHIQFSGVPGSRYWFQVGGIGGASGSLAFELLHNPKGNDNISDAIPLPFAPIAVGGSNVGASLEAGEYQPCGNIGATIWYRIDLGADAHLTFETSGSSFNTVLAVYQWDTGSPYPTFLACNDDVSGSEKWSKLSLSVRPGSQYYIQVGGAGSDYGSVKLAMASSFLPPPATSTPVPSNAYPKTAYNEDGSITVYVDHNGNGQPDAGETVVTVPRLPDDGELVFNPKIQSNADGSTTVYNDTNRNGAPDPSETIVTIPRTPRVRARINVDNTVTIYDDKDNDGSIDSGEEIYTTPVPPAGIPVNPKVLSNPDGSTTIYNDANSNDQVDPGETIITIPKVGPNIKIRLNPNSTVTIYDDKDNDGSIDSGEEIYTTPVPPAGIPVNPKVLSNPDGSTTIYNDANSNDQVDPGETIITLPAVVIPPPTNDNRASAAQIPSRAYIDLQLPKRATVEADEPTDCGTLRATVWYRWSRAGSVLVDTQGSTYSVMLAVYSVGTNGALTLVGCSTVGTHNATFGFVAEPGKTYLVQVGNLASMTDERVLKFSVVGL